MWERIRSGALPGIAPGWSALRHGQAFASSVTDHELPEGALLRHGVFPPTPELQGELTENHISLYLGPTVQVIESNYDGKKSKAKLRPGEFAIGPRGRRFSVAWANSAEFLTLVGGQSIFTSVAQGLGTPASTELRVIDRIRDSHIEFLLRALHEDRLTGNAAGPLYQELLLPALATRIIANFSYRPVPQRRSKAGLPIATLRRLTEYIDQRLDQAITLSELAREANLSPHYFCEQFRRSTGQSPHQHLLHRRIERAKTLPNDPDLTLTEIAYRAGFSSQAHFTGMFHRLVGVTPGVYRECQRNNNGRANLTIESTSLADFS